MFSYETNKNCPLDLKPLKSKDNVQHIFYPINYVREMKNVGTYVYEWEEEKKRRLKT